MKSAVKTSPVDMKKRASLDIKAGDTVRVWQKITELKKQKQANKKEVLTQSVRRQAFEGTVLAVKHGKEAGGTFTVRKVSLGIGVERIFPLYSPMIDDVEILRRARTRRAKLYFIRRKAAHDIKRAMRRQMQVTATPDSIVEDITGNVPEVSAESEQTAAEAQDKVE